MTAAIREARFQDIRAIVRLAEEAHKRSPYADATMNPESVKLIARQSIANSMAGPNSSSVILVAEDKSGVHGVFVGAAVHLYECLETVWCTNHFWYVRPGSNARSGLKLLDAFHEWATQRFDWVLFRVGLNATLMDTDRIEKVMRRRGYKRSGVIVEKEYRKWQ